MKKKESPFIIGITGPSCSGKTVIAHQLMTQFQKENPIVLSMDDYYKPVNHLSKNELEVYNFDHPNAIEHELLINHVKALINGDTIQKPHYNFETHTRSHTSTIRPSQIIIIEGLHLLYYSELKQHCNLSLFLSVHKDDAIKRRLHRDVIDRKENIGSIKNRFEKWVVPMQTKFIYPYQHRANAILPPSADFNLISKIVTHYRYNKSPLDTIIK